MKSENEKLTEAARTLSRNCEERLDSCKGCLFCRSDLLCKLRGVPAEWNRDFGLDEHIVDVNKRSVHQLIHQPRPMHQLIHQLPAPKSSTPRRKS